MKVSIATQVFSKTVAAGIGYCALSYLPSTDGLSRLDASALDTSDLIEIFDSVYGSVAPSFGKTLRQLVSHKSLHAEEWLRSIHTIKTMEFRKSKPTDRSKPLVLTGWIRTLNGFLTIRKILLEKEYLSFVPRNFNQDPIENFFGQIRQFGVKNTNPTCQAFSTYYYKALLIKNIQYHPRESNCEDDVSHHLTAMKDLLIPFDVSHSDMSCTLAYT